MSSSTFNLTPSSTFLLGNPKPSLSIISRNNGGLNPLSPIPQFTPLCLGLLLSCKIEDEPSHHRSCTGDKFTYWAPPANQPTAVGSDNEISSEQLVNSDGQHFKDEPSHHRSCTGDKFTYWAPPTNQPTADDSDNEISTEQLNSDGIAVVEPMDAILLAGMFSCPQNDARRHRSSAHSYVGDRYKHFGNQFLSQHCGVMGITGGFSVRQLKRFYQVMGAVPESAEKVSAQLVKEGLPVDLTNSLNNNRLTPQGLVNKILIPVCVLGTICPLFMVFKMGKDLGLLDKIPRLVSADPLAGFPGWVGHATTAVSLTELARRLIGPPAPVGSNKQLCSYIKLGNTYNYNLISGIPPITFIILTCIYVLFTFFLCCELVKAINSRKV